MPGIQLIADGEQVPGAVEYTSDIDDWLTVIATGRCVGITVEATVAQYPRPGVVYRPMRDAAPCPSGSPGGATTPTHRPPPPSVCSPSSTVAERAIRGGG